MPFVNGGGAAFNGGTITGALGIAPTTDVVAEKITGAVGATNDLLEVVDDATSNTTILRVSPNGLLALNRNQSVFQDMFAIADFLNSRVFAVTYTGEVLISPDAGQDPALRVNGNVLLTGGLQSQAITAGALPTTTFVSGTGKQILTTRDVCLVVPFTGDATNNAATLLIQLSPDNSTYSTLDTLSIAAALNLTGALNVPVTLQVPAAWYVKLTATHGTIGTATYY